MSEAIAFIEFSLPDPWLSSSLSTFSLRLLENILNSENAKKVRNAVEKLPEDEAEIIIMIYYSGISLKDYADKKRLTYIQPFNKKNRILRKLRRSITNSNTAN